MYSTPDFKHTYTHKHTYMYIHEFTYISCTYIYYPPEVSRRKYCYLGVFWKEYFRLVTNWCNGHLIHWALVSITA